MEHFLQLFDTWHLIRLLGFLAFFFFTFSLAFGMLSRLSYAKKNKGLFHFIHISSSWAGLFSMLGHMLILLIDHYQPYKILDIVVPFASHYKTFASALGTIAFFIFIIVLFTSDVLMAKMDRSLWKWIHLSVFPAWLLLLLHGLLLGTDTSSWWASAIYGASTVIILVLFTIKSLDKSNKKAVSKQSRSSSV